MTSMSMESKLFTRPVKRVKFIKDWDIERLETNINDFLETHCSVLDIRFQQTNNKHNDVLYTVMVIYEVHI